MVLINEAMAKQFWPGLDPVGQQILIGKDLGPKFRDTSRQIVGVVGDTRDDNLSQASEPTMIIPDAQEPDQMVALEAQFGPRGWLIRTRLELVAVALSWFSRVTAEQAAAGLSEASEPWMTFCPNQLQGKNSICCCFLYLH